MFNNLDWTAFFVALVVFTLAANLFNLAKAYWLKRRADNRVKTAERKLAGLKQLLKENEEKLYQVITKEGKP
jgi:hypothetical protein